MTEGKVDKIRRHLVLQVLILHISLLVSSQAGHLLCVRLRLTLLQFLLFLLFLQLLVWYHRHHNKLLVEHKDLEVGREYNVDTEALREANTSDLSVHLCERKNLERLYLFADFAWLVGPKVYFLRRVRHIDIVVRVLHKVLDVSLMVFVLRLLFNAELQRFPE